MTSLGTSDAVQLPRDLVTFLMPDLVGTDVGVRVGAAPTTLGWQVEPGMGINERWI